MTPQDTTAQPTPAVTSSVRFDGGDGYDIIGDVHGCADELEQLLQAMDYEQRDGVWRHGRRQAIFVGDLIDRGPRQVGTYRIARSMVDSGAAQIVAANHEFNAIAWATPVEDRPTGFLRNHDTKFHQHEVFLREVGSESELHREIIDWFKTLPLWLDLGGIRVVHACWDKDNIEWLTSTWGQTPMGKPEFMRLATDGKAREYVAIEHVLKGPEIAITPPQVAGDRARSEARLNWWMAEPGGSRQVRLGDVAHIPSSIKTVDGLPYQLDDPDRSVQMPVEPYDRTKPVFFGHYWRIGTPTIENPHMACTDWSAVKGGCLAAYRWSGETELTNQNWVSIASTQK